MKNAIRNTTYDMREAGQNRIQSFAFVIGVCVAACFSWGFVSDLAGFEPALGRCEIELESRVNPNEAPLASLVRLPNVGIVRAEAIIEYRRGSGGEDGESQAFQNCDDLRKISGIGPKTVQNISPWLKFE